MKARHLQLVLLAILFALSSCISMDSGQSSGGSDPFARSGPKFPDSEYFMRREGWVVLGYTVSRGGIVDDVHIRDSSGNSNFEDAALDGIRDWRFEPGEQERETTVLVTFLDGYETLQLSRQFSKMYSKANELIDAGELERTEELLADLRDDQGLHPSELAYTFFLEGRIAAERGDRAEQLFLVRKAMLSDGRWLAYDHYLDSLHLAVALALEQEDLASALRDYGLLTGSSAGRKLVGEDLEEMVRSARIRAEADPALPEPYVVADTTRLVQPAVPEQYKGMKGPKNSATGTRRGENRPARGPRGGGATKTKN